MHVVATKRNQVPTSLSNLGDLKPRLKVREDVRVHTKGGTDVRAKERKSEMPRHEDRRAGKKEHMYVTGEG